MIHRLTDHLILHWEAIVGDRLPVPERIQVMKFGSVTDFPRSYVYLYAFLDDAAEPALVLKITADRASQARLVREFDLVGRIRARVSPEIAATIPDALAGLPFGSYWVGVEEVAGGRRVVPVVDLTRRHDGRRVESFMELVLDWVVAFGESGTGEEPFAGDLFARAVSEPLARLRSYYDLERSEVTYLDALGSRLEARRGQPVRTVAMHGDLWAGNIYVAEDGLRVIDWTGFRERDASYHDLFNFLDSFVVHRDRLGESAVGVRGPGAHTLYRPPEPGDWFRGLVSRYVDRYIERLGLDQGMVQLLLPMYYVSMATRREPVNEASVAVNHKFRGVLSSYIRTALRAGDFSLPGPWGPGSGDSLPPPSPGHAAGAGSPAAAAGARIDG